MSARKRKLIFKRYSLGRGPHWRFFQALRFDMERAILFGNDVPKPSFTGSRNFYYTQSALK